MAKYWRGGQLPTPAPCPYGHEKGCVREGDKYYCIKILSGLNQGPNSNSAALRNAIDTFLQYFD